MLKSFQTNFYLIDEWQIAEYSASHFFNIFFFKRNVCGLYYEIESVLRESVKVREIMTGLKNATFTVDTWKYLYVKEISR